MTTAELCLLRLHAQHLLSPGVNPAADMCGLQAQFLRNAMHALRIRSGKTNVDGLVKTWTLRGTVHLVPEDDLPLYLRNCGGAEAICQSGWYRWTAERGQANPPAREIELARLALEAIAQGIDEREALRLHLRDCGMTRDEEARAFHPWGGLIAELANIGAIAFQVKMKANDRPDEAKRYRLLHPFAPMEEHAARLELARRYFTHYGPATLRDAASFFHWTQADIKALLPQLPVETCIVDGREHFFIPSGNPEGDIPPVLLLAGFDPLLLGYRKEENPFLPPAHLRGIFSLSGIVHPAILLHGRIVGKWKEKDGKVDFTAFEPLSGMDKARIAQEAERLSHPRTITWT